MMLIAIFAMGATLELSAQEQYCPKSIEGIKNGK